jgi:hypothetical protein
MTERMHICGRHRDGCPKPHQFSVPVELVGVDVVVPEGMRRGIALCDGDSLLVLTTDAEPDSALRRFTFTHRGAPHEYRSGDRVVREGWLALPTADETPQ